MDAVVIDVGHDDFFELTQDDTSKFFKAEVSSNKVLFDIKGVLDRKEFENHGYNFWRF